MKGDFHIIRLKRVKIKRQRLSTVSDARIILKIIVFYFMSKITKKDRFETCFKDSPKTGYAMGPVK